MSDFQLRFFTVEEGCLRKASQAAVIDLWEGKRPWPVADVDELRIVTVLCDREIKPLVWHVTRVTVREGPKTHVAAHTKRLGVQVQSISRPATMPSTESSLKRIGMPRAKLCWITLSKGGPRT